MPSSASSLVLGYPKSRKKFKDDSFTLPDPSYLGFRRYNKNHDAVRIPKVGWVKLRLASARRRVAVQRATNLLFHFLLARQFRHGFTLR
jgi:hypothetical protein